MKAGIYVHLPFCTVHCTYCDFPLTTRLSLSKPYYQALLREIEMHPAPGLADTLYFGGGTPSLTPPQVLHEIRTRFDLEPLSEITLEANPNDIDADRAAAWREIGINRISIGVQSLEPAALRAILRQHSTVDTMHALRFCRDAGFENTNVDLIIGSPHQTVAGFLSGVRTLIDFHPQHFSIYFLEIHDTTGLYRQLQQQKTAVMPEEEQITCYTEAVQLLKESGYRHYEVSNFALPGFESRHNLKYWTNAPYEAYGAGACSYFNGFRRKNIADVEQYMEAIQKNELPFEEMIEESSETTMRNALIFGMRKTEGVDRYQFQREFGKDPASLFPAELLDNGMLEIADSRLRLTFRGLLLSNEVLSNVI